MKYKEFKILIAWARAHAINVAQLRHKDLKNLIELYKEYNSKLK